MIGYLKIAGIVAVVTAIGFGYWHYTSLVSDLKATEAANVILTSQRDSAISTANANAAAAAKTDADRLRVVAELEVAHEEIAAAAARDLETVREILSAPDEEDGPVSPLLEKLRASVSEVGHDVFVADRLVDTLCHCGHFVWVSVRSEGDHRRACRRTKDRGAEFFADVLVGAGGGIDVDPGTRCRSVSRQARRCR